MYDVATASPLVLCVLVVVVGAACSLFPLSPVEPWLIGVGAVAPHWLILPLILLVTVSSMAAKTLVFLGGRRVGAAFTAKTRDRFEQIRTRIAGKPGLQRGTLFLSSVVGFPPFYLITALCGTLRMPLQHFVLLGTTGRAIRFAVLLLLPQLFLPSEARAQVPSSAVRVAGQGGDTYVLVAGLVGGVAGFARLEARLVAAGHRVVSIDPYQLAVDSSDVSLHAMARLVDGELETRGIRRAIVVGHAHGGGVALRLAANAPRRVSALYLLDVGAAPSNRGTVFSSAIRLVPVIARIPAGKTFIRHRIVAGLRENSGNAAWIDDSTGRLYAQPLLDNVDRVVAMAGRLSRAEEPETVDQVVGRVDVPITVLVGGVRTRASPIEGEFRAFEAIGSRFRLDTVSTAGHFPHEEAPDQVARLILRGSRAAIALVSDQHPPKP